MVPGDRNNPFESRGKNHIGVIMEIGCQLRNINWGIGRDSSERYSGMASGGTSRACRRLRAVLSLAGKFGLVLARVGCIASWLVTFVLVGAWGAGTGSAVVEIVQRSDWVGISLDVGVDRGQESA